MACQSIVQNSAATLLVYIQQTDNTPATGLTFADVTASLKKDTNPFAVFTLTGVNFVEVANGYYDISLLAADTDTLGNLYLSILGSGLITTLATAFVAVTVPAPTPTVATPPNTTDLFGFVYDAAASAVANASVTARVLANPTVLFTPEGMAAETDLVTVTTDAQGFFTITLLEGADVDIFIPAANYRRTLNVPAANTNLFSIP